MVVVFLSFIVIGMALPVLPLHVHDVLGFGPLVGGHSGGRPVRGGVDLSPLGWAAFGQRGASLETRWSNEEK
jgi:hypothetical protein